MPRSDLENPISSVQRYSLLWLFVAIVLVAIMGNTLTLLTLYHRKYQVLYKCCLASQAFSDLLISMFVGIDSMDKFLHDDVSWRLGSFMCNWQPFITTAGVLTTSMTLTCIAFDRYQGIILLREKWDPQVRASFLTMACIWLASAGISVPLYLGYHLVEVCSLDCITGEIEFQGLCMVNDVKEKNHKYFTTVFAIIFLPVVAAFVGLYTVIANYMWIKSKPKEKREATSVTGTNDTNLDPISTSPETIKKEEVTGAVNQDNIKQRRSRSSEKKSRTFKLIILIIGTFLVCRLPQWVFILVSTSPSISLTSNLWWMVKYLLSALSLTNTAVNPFVYSFLNQVLSFKQNVKQGIYAWRKPFQQCYKQKNAYSVKQ